MRAPPVRIPAAAQHDLDLLTEHAAEFFEYLRIDPPPGGKYSPGVIVGAALAASRLFVLKMQAGEAQLDPGNAGEIAGSEVERLKNDLDTANTVLDDERAARSADALAAQSQLNDRSQEVERLKNDLDTANTVLDDERAGELERRAAGKPSTGRDETQTDLQQESADYAVALTKRTRVTVQQYIEDRDGLAADLLTQARSDGRNFAFVVFVVMAIAAGVLWFWMDDRLGHEHRRLTTTCSVVSDYSHKYVPWCTAIRGR